MEDLSKRIGISMFHLEIYNLPKHEKHRLYKDDIAVNVMIWLKPWVF